MTFDEELEQVHIAGQKVVHERQAVESKKALDREEIVEREVRR